MAGRQRLGLVIEPSQQMITLHAGLSTLMGLGSVRMTFTSGGIVATRSSQTPRRGLLVRMIDTTQGRTPSGSGANNSAQRSRGQTLINAIGETLRTFTEALAAEHSTGCMLTPGKITSVLDAQYGSTAKGVISAHLTKAHRPDFLMTANGRNSSHTVVDGGRTIVFKVLPVGTFYNGHNNYTPLVYLGPGSAFMVDDLRKEMGLVGLHKSQVLIHPRASIVTEADIAFENGLADFAGNPLSGVDHTSGTTAHGTTGSGAGAARAKKSLRKGRIARDEPELAEMLCDPEYIIDRFNKDGRTGLLDGSQGFLLSLYGRFHPHCTSRPVTLSGFFSDMDLPPSLIGNVAAVARTYPIRIASKRYFADGRFLTWHEAQRLAGLNVPIEEIDSNSGGHYPDQVELTWEEVSLRAGRVIAPELTTLTKLPRRIFSWSKLAMLDFLRQNRPPEPFETSLFLTFTNYLKDGTLDEFLRSSGISALVTDNELSELYSSDGPETDSVRHTPVAP